MSYVLRLFVALGLAKFFVMAESFSGSEVVVASPPRAQPRSRAPEVSIDHLVQSTEQGLGTHKLLQVSQCSSPLVVGLDIFCKGNKITDEVLELSKDVLFSLTRVDASGIWKRFSCKMLAGSWT